MRAMSPAVISKLGTASSAATAAMFRFAMSSCSAPVAVGKPPPSTYRAENRIGKWRIRYFQAVFTLFHHFC